ncbi:MAG: AraC family transcriptional regulator ligand-binding domain-containing protein [Kordiimonadaceae bacterium]|nr:AraC family transcriptional regulator ligand-binding domain-containing protein [Kordiimonadaceae bacterium]
MIETPTFKGMKHSQSTYGHYVPLSHVALLASFAQCEKIDFDQLLINHGLHNGSTGGPSAVIPAPKYTELLLAVDACTSDRSFWFRFGRTLDFPAHGILGQAIICTATLGEALETLAEFYPLISCGSALKTERRKGHLALHILRLSPIEARESIIRSEILISTLAQAAQQRLPDGGVRLKYQFDYGKPDHHALYETYLGAACTFAADQSKLIVPADYLQAANQQANAVMYKMFREECRQAVNVLESQNTLISKVKKLITAVPDKFPAAAEVATQLGLSDRSMSRHLKNANTSFLRVLNQSKSRRAVQLLKTTAFSIDEIGFRVGYNNSANFRRAFVKWTGKTPSAVRAAGNVLV